MNDSLTVAANSAVERYRFFLSILRSLVSTALRDGAHDARVRSTALNSARGAARTFMDTERTLLEAATEQVAAETARRISEEIGGPPLLVDQRIGTYLAEARDHLLDVLAAQVQRDAATVYRTVQTLGLRTDIYMRSGDYSLPGARAQIDSEEGRLAQFSFVDRMGRLYKSTKHIRDSWRLHLVNVQNELTLYLATESGVTHLFVNHPNPDYASFGRQFTAVDDGSGLPLFYNIRADIFHPGTEAWITTERP